MMCSECVFMTSNLLYFLCVPNLLNLLFINNLLCVLFFYLGAIIFNFQQVHVIDLVWSDYLRYSVGSHLVAFGVQTLNLTVISPLVGDVESGGDRASVRVDAAPSEEVGVQLFVQVVDGVVKRQQNDLRHLL